MLAENEKDLVIEETWITSNVSFIFHTIYYVPLSLRGVVYYILSLRDNSQADSPIRISEGGECVSTLIK